MKRRSFLQGGAALALASWARRARAQDSGDTGRYLGLPKRFILVHVPQGTVMAEFVPSGSSTDFTLPFILEPLQAHQDRICLVTGVDNYCPQLNAVGSAHDNANLSFLTARPFYEQNASALSAGGPSIEQVLAERLGVDTPFPRLDFSIGGSATSNGLRGGTDGVFWHGINDPVMAYNDPTTALLRIFGDDSISAEEAWAARAHRASVLDKVMRGFGELEPHLSSADRIRLQSHQDKVEQLYKRMVAGTGSCTRPVLDLGSSYDYTTDDNLSAPLMNDLLVTALSCDHSRVATLGFANSHDHDFPWLWADNGGQPIVDRSVYDSWHTMVHDDWVPGAELVYRWYISVFADLLDKLAATTDADGDNMLETSLVLCISEYSSGRHWNNALPMIFAGNLAGASTGRWLDFLTMDGATFQDEGAYAYSGHNVSQAYVSILQAFGYEDEAFGYEGDFELSEWTGVQVGGSMPQGPLPGLLDG